MYEYKYTELAFEEGIGSQALQQTISEELDRMESNGQKIVSLSWRDHTHFGITYKQER